MMTPERAWELMRRGVKRRLNANLTELMQEFEADDEPASGKPGWAMRVANAEVKRAKDAAQRCYDACRTEWKKQDRMESFAFFEAVYKYGLIPLISERNLDAERQFKRLTARVNKGNGVNRDCLSVSLTKRVVMHSRRSKQIDQRSARRISLSAQRAGGLCRRQHARRPPCFLPPSAYRRVAPHPCRRTVQTSCQPSSYPYWPAVR